MPEDTTGSGAVSNDAVGDVPRPAVGSPMAVGTDEGAGGQATFGVALEGLRATGASSGTRDLVELIARHGAEEGELLATYERLATEAPDASVRYLIDLILEDERRHHRLLAELSNAMAWDSVGQPPEPVTPRLPRKISGALYEQTRLLRKSEQADYRALRRIRRRLRPFASTTLWGLIIDLMLLDTKKHATILRFLERRRHDG